MKSQRPAEPGFALTQVETPALILDLDIFERNLAIMEADLAGSGVRLRAHAKAHKCVEIARRQIAAGAVGVCCQKVSEAAAMVEGGIGDVLVTNEVVSPAKLAHLSDMARHANIAVCCDNADVVPLLSEAASSAGVTLQVLVEIDVGGGRCGVVPGDAAAVLAGEIEGAEGLEFVGLQAYCGPAQHKRTIEERRHATEATVEGVRKTKEALAKIALDRDWVTGGGTGSYPFERDSGIFTEVQAGSYAFLDADYARNLDENDRPSATFAHSLFLLSTVISTTGSTRAILDAGHKAHSYDSGPAQIFAMSGVEIGGQSDEHMVVNIAEDGSKLHIGDQIRLIPGHVDPTFNLHDWLVCIRGDVVEDVWPISARGPGL
jgi:3-hydroxy-D-aspartate aldolase